jgi:hypothetical protein
MATVFRGLCSIVAGVLLAFVQIIAVEYVSTLAHPFPADFNHTTEEMCKHVARYPDWVLALVVPAWGGTTFVSTWVTKTIGNRGCGTFIGLLMLAAVCFNIAMLPYPIWFKVANLIAIPAAIYFGLRSPGRASPVVSHAN